MLRDIGYIELYKREKRHTRTIQFSTAAYLFERHLIYTKRLINPSELGNTLGHSDDKDG